LQAVQKGLAFICTAQATTQIENCVVIIQWQYTQILLQLLESITNLLGIVLMGFCIGMVELIQYRLTIRIARVKGMSYRLSLLQKWTSNVTPPKMFW